jgi:stage V sporulation protein G
MDITEVKVFPIQEEKLKAFVSIVFDHCFMVNDIKIIQGRDGLFISMPSRKKKNGEFKDVAHPLNNETRRMIEDKVLGEYERVLAERGEKMPRPAHLAPPSQLASDDAAGAATLAAAAATAGNAPAGLAEVPGGFPAAAPVAATPGPYPGGSAAAGSAVVPLDARAPGDGAAALSTAPPAAGLGGPVASAAEKSLEEIEEMHLRDSFWTVT